MHGHVVVKQRRRRSANAGVSVSVTRGACEQLAGRHHDGANGANKRQRVMHCITVHGQ